MITFLVIVFIMVVGFAGLGIMNHNTLQENETLKTELNSNQVILTSTKKELSLVQEELLTETEKYIELNNTLQSTNAELENVRAMLDAANITIEDLKSEEYELVYVGDFRFTYYCDERYEHICGYGIGLTASGKPTEVGWTVAADTSVLPMGSIIYVEGVGFREVMDRGGGVKGNHIDILMQTHNECFQQTLTNGGVWVLIKKGS